MCRDLNALFRFLFPAARWNTICVSRDCISLLHADTANVPGSPNLSLALGSFTGGQLWLEDLHCLHLGAPTSNPLGGFLASRCRRRHPLPPYQLRWTHQAYDTPLPG